MTTQGTASPRTAPTDAAADAPALLAELARLAMARGQHDDAGAVLGALAVLRPQEPAVDLLGGLLFFAEGRYGDAEARYRRIVDRHPEDDTGRVFLAEALLAQGRWRQAGELLDAVRRAGRQPQAVALAEQLAEGLTTGLFQGRGRAR